MLYMTEDNHWNKYTLKPQAVIINVRGKTEHKVIIHSRDSSNITNWIEDFEFSTNNSLNPGMKYQNFGLIQKTTIN